MYIDKIENGIVIDHIKAGKGIIIYEHLGLNKVDDKVAFIKNVRSGDLGKKDILKIETTKFIDISILGLISPDVTINIIKNGKLQNKKKVDLPKEIVNVIKCKNPRCITSSERDLEHIFILKSVEKKEYRCIYCENKYDDKGKLI
ncbi:MAG: aspartate carbamoyltransferase regulatory subunit [Lachnospirales bacterium]